MSAVDSLGQWHSRITVLTKFEGAATKP